MISYNNGKIYKIEPVNCEEGDIYIGSTTKKHLCQRMATHKYMYKQWKQNKFHKVTSFDLFDKYGLDNVNIILLESVNANSKDELLSRESYYIKTLLCVNKVIPNRKQNEYYQDNKETICKNNKSYVITNKEEIKIKNSMIYQLNKDDVKLRSANYYKCNKNTIAEKKKILYNCECGSNIQCSCKSEHFKSKKHINFLSLNNE